MFNWRSTVPDTHVLHGAKYSTVGTVSSIQSATSPEGLFSAMIDIHAFRQAKCVNICHHLAVVVAQLHECWGVVLQKPIRWKIHAIITEWPSECLFNERFHRTWRPLTGRIVAAPPYAICVTLMSPREWATNSKMSGTWICALQTVVSILVHLGINRWLKHIRERFRWGE